MEPKPCHLDVANVCGPSLECHSVESLPGRFTEHEVPVLGINFISYFQGSVILTYSCKPFHVLCADAYGEQHSSRDTERAAERVRLCDAACSRVRGHHPHDQPLGTHAHAQGQVCFMVLLCASFCRSLIIRRILMHMRKDG